VLGQENQEAELPSAAASLEGVGRRFSTTEIKEDVGRATTDLHSTVSMVR